MRVVLDTSTVVSAFLFSGTCSRLLPLWKAGRLEILLSKEIWQEYLRVLAYPKFKLSGEEINGLLEEELLPFARTVQVKRRLKVVKNDPEDDKFVECAVAGRAAAIITGDRDLLALKSFRRIRIVDAAQLLEELGV